MPTWTSPVLHFGAVSLAAAGDDAAGQAALTGASLAGALRNLRMMRLLERIGHAFNEAGIPLMVLKGAALNLLIYERADLRAMDDLDVMIHPEHVAEARKVLDQMGGLRAAPQVREDFFPRFHYETEYKIGAFCPVKVDLHVRPFRPMRYAVTVPTAAFWSHAQSVAFGGARLLLPSAENMLIHMAVHAAVHGQPRAKWLEDIRRWLEVHDGRLHWGQIIARLTDWGLVLPFRQAMHCVEQELGGSIPPDVSCQLEAVNPGFCERLALWQAPRDAAHPVAHVAVNAFCTPGWRFSLAYLLALIFPGRAYMADWYDRRHVGWQPCAHLLRWLSPLFTRLPRLRTGLGRPRSVTPF